MQELPREPVCTCDVGLRAQIVHEGDCPVRCTFYQRDTHSQAIAQCERVAGHLDDHSPNLYRGSPSQRRERGRIWPVPEPQCDHPIAVAQQYPYHCTYYYIETDNACTLPFGHRERHNPHWDESDWALSQGATK